MSEVNTTATKAPNLENVDRELKTMVFTDMVGSTQLKQELGDAQAMKLIQQHHTLVRELLSALPGATEIETAGDSFFLAFKAPSDAVRFAMQFQARLRKLAKTVGYPLQDRIGIHVGEVFRHMEVDTDRLADLNGIQVDTCARVMSLAGPSQTLLTRFAFDNAQQMLKNVKIEGVGTLEWNSHGLYHLKGISSPVEICEVAERGATDHRPPNDSEKAHRVQSELSPELLPLTQPKPEPPLRRRLFGATARERHHATVGAVAIALIGVVLLFSSLLDPLSLDLSYFSHCNLTPQNYTNDVEFVVMDNDSLAKLGQPALREWDRRLHARLINQMTAAHARAVVFDVVFQTNRPAEDPAFLAAVRANGHVAVAVAQRQEIENGTPVTKNDVPFEELSTNAWKDRKSVV
jgi:class 3 adenylate cyclase